MRGIVSLAAALALPATTASGAPFPFRSEIILLTFAVILSTLVLQGLTPDALIRALRLVMTRRSSSRRRGRGRRRPAPPWPGWQLAADPCPPGRSSVAVDVHAAAPARLADPLGEDDATARARAAFRRLRHERSPRSGGS